MRLSFLKLIAIALISGFAAGIVGALIIEAYFVPSAYVMSVGKWTEVKKKIPTSELRIGGEVGRVAFTVVDIYLAKPEPDSKDILDKIYLDNLKRGKGVILTSDGWILTTKSTFGDLKEKALEEKYLIITSTGKSYEVKEFILDKVSDIVFLKVEAEDLPVIQIGSREKLEVGQTIATFDDSGIVTTKIASLNYETPFLEKKDLIKSSEKFSKFIFLEDPIFEKGGNPLINSEGEVVGLLAFEGARVAIPIDYIKSAFVDILKYKKIKRTFLGVNYIDLASIRLKENATVGLKKGALLYENKDLKIKATIPKSPAEAAGLKAGDIILKIDKEELSSTRDLTELIQEYQPGNSLDLLVLRAREERIVRVKLEELK